MRLALMIRILPASVARKERSAFREHRDHRSPKSPLFGTDAQSFGGMPRLTSRCGGHGMPVVGQHIRCVNNKRQFGFHVDDDASKQIDMIEENFFHRSNKWTVTKNVPPATRLWR